MILNPSFRHHGWSMSERMWESFGSRPSGGFCGLSELIKKPTMDNYYEEVLNQLKKSEENRKVAFRRNLPSYIWLVVKDLFAFAIILAVFNSATTSFETLLFSLLVLIYLSVEGFFSSYGYKTAQTTMGLANELLQIKKLLKYQENEEEVEKREKALVLFQKLDTCAVIHSVFLLIFFLITLAKLLSSL